MFADHLEFHRERIKHVTAKIEIATLIAAFTISTAMAQSVTSAQNSPQITLESSSTYWSKGDHADLVIYYDDKGATPPIISYLSFFDLGGAIPDMTLNSCGTYIAGTGWMLQPGQISFLRTKRTGASIVGYAPVSNTTGSSVISPAMSAPASNCGTHRIQPSTRRNALSAH